MDKTSENFDIIIVGAGLAGINAAYQIKTLLPHKSFAILEARSEIGGTWSLFKYPGLRCDSYMTAYGFDFNPWSKDSQIGSGDEIYSYIRESASKAGIDKQIRLKHEVKVARWSSKAAKWDLEVDADGTRSHIHCHNVLWGSGYYDHRKPKDPLIPGLGNFKGVILHPQFWDSNVDYSNKKIVVIGSGSTATTLVPALTEKASHVTMLQRSPTYIIPSESLPADETFYKRWLPAQLANGIIRWKYDIMVGTLFTLMDHFPNFMRKALRSMNEKLVPKSVPYSPHFEPLYDPGKQRLCVALDGDFFNALESGKASIVTDTIKQVIEGGIEVASGDILDADMIVTATGFKMQVFGGAKILVDDREIIPGEKLMWNGSMVQDVPNSSLLIGYTAAPWTPGTNSACLLAVKMMKMTEDKGMRSWTPKLDERDGKKVERERYFTLDSRYMREGVAVVPKAGDKPPWGRRVGYTDDWWTLNFADLGKEVAFAN